MEALEQGPRHLFLAASYDGYAGLKDPVSLRRRIFLDLEGGLVTLVDQVQAEGQHVCEVLFHLPPETRVEPAGQGSFMLSGPFGQALFKPEPKAKVTLITGRSNPPLGWPRPWTWAGWCPRRCCACGRSWWATPALPT